jgi:hypothetical protein
MDLAEVLKQPEGFTPPDVTVTIEKVFAFKSGEGENGPWSFQDVQVKGGGKLKLKGLMREFPADRVGQTVTIRANQSKQHGLTGLKVAHEEYQNKTYDKLIVTSSAKWEWGAASTNGNGNNGSMAHAASASQNGPLNETTYADHLLSCAELAAVIGSHLSLDDPQALQACFATICIDTKNRNILLPKPKTLPAIDDHADEPPMGGPPDDPFDDNDIPF